MTTTPKPAPTSAPTQKESETTMESDLRKALNKAQEVNVPAGINFLNQMYADVSKQGDSLQLLIEFREHLNRRISELSAPNSPDNDAAPKQISAPTEQDNLEAQGIVDSCYYTDDGITGGYARGALIRTIAAALQAERERTRAEEREACADLVERIQVRVPSKVVGDVINGLCDKIAAAIRARALEAAQLPQGKVK